MYQPPFNSFNSLFFGVMKTENFLQIIFVSFLLLSNEPKLITTDFFFLTLNLALWQDDLWSDHFAVDLHCTSKKQEQKKTKALSLRLCTMKCFKDLFRYGQNISPNFIFKNYIWGTTYSQLSNKIASRVGGFFCWLRKKSE